MRKLLYMLVIMYELRSGHPHFEIPQGPMPDKWCIFSTPNGSHAGSLQWERMKIDNPWETEARWIRHAHPWGKFGTSGQEHRMVRQR